MKGKFQYNALGLVRSGKVRSGRKGQVERGILVGSKFQWVELIALKFRSVMQVIIRRHIHCTAASHYIANA